jgi:excisionase family DNA binding protein
VTSPLLPVAEAAQGRRVSRSLLYLEVGRRRLKVVTIGHLTRIREEELDRYVRANEIEGLG